jgi:hypothetical protein
MLDPGNTGGDLRRCYLVLGFMGGFGPGLLFEFVYRLRLPFGPLLRSNISEIQGAHTGAPIRRGIPACLPSCHG